MSTTTTTTTTTSDSIPRNKRMSSSRPSKRTKSEHGQSPSVNGGSSLSKPSAPLVGPIDHNLRSPPAMMRGTFYVKREKRIDSLSVVFWMEARMTIIPFAPNESNLSLQSACIATGESQLLSPRSVTKSKGSPSSRYDSSLGLLTKKFVDLLQVRSPLSLSKWKLRHRLTGAFHASSTDYRNNKQ